MNLSHIHTVKHHATTGLFIPGIETAVKFLEEALVLLRKTAPNPMYRKICQLLALCLGEKQPQRTAEYLSQSMSVTLRHQKLTSLAKKLR